MLLTGGQISAGISSFIVCLFTSILFISGYVIQQRTVRDMQVILHPPQPSNITPSSPLEPTAVVPEKQVPTYADDGLPIDWERVAYGQYVQKHEDVCEAVMTFAELSRTKSPAQRLLVYPRTWDEEYASGQWSSTRLGTSMRLLKKAIQRYKALVVSMEMGMAEASHQQEEYDTFPPAANLLRLTKFDRILHLIPHGLILNSELLDGLFALPMNNSLVSVTGNEPGVSHASLMKPSLATFLRSSRSKVRDTVYLDVPTEVACLGNSSSPLLLTQTSSLRFPFYRDPETSGTSIMNFHEAVAYVRFSDPEIIGPQYDVPKWMYQSAEPRDREARSLWNSLYDRFRVERMSVCGLDIEPMPITNSQE